MSFATEVAKHVNAPVVLVDIYFNSGTRYYSNTYVNVYKGKILNLPQILTSIGDVKRTYEKNRISIIFNDSNYEFRGLEATETVGFRNVRVVAKVGFSDGSTLTTSTLFDGQIYDYKRLDDLRYQIDIEEKGKNLDNEYPDKRVELTDYPNAHHTALGWVVPIVFGTISANGLSNDGAYGMPSLSLQTGLPFVKTTQDAEQHLLGIDNSGSGALYAHRVYIDGVLKTEGVHYSVDSWIVDGVRHSYIQWVAGVRPTEVNFISADVEATRQRPVYMIYNFLKAFCGYVTGDFNATSLSYAYTIEAARNYYMDGALWQKATLRSILDSWRDEFEFDLYWDKNGLICIKYLSVAFDSGANHYYDYLDILRGYESSPKIDEILNYLKYGYNYNYSKTYFYNYGTKQDTASQTKYGATFKEFKGFYFARASAQAYDIAARKIIRLKDPLCLEKYALPLKTYQNNLTDLIRITHFEGGGSAGHANRLFQLREFNYNLDNFINEALFEDTTNYTGRACILGDGTALAATWAAADADDRQYCYMCSSADGLFSDGESGKMLVD